MDAWLKTHVAIVSPIADAFYAADSDIKALANNRSLVVKMVRAIRTAFAALRAQGIPIAPSKLQIIELLPEWMLVSACCLSLRTSSAELIIARHALVAREEMVVLAEQLRVLVWQDGGNLFSFTTLRGDTVSISGQGLYRYDPTLMAMGFKAGDAVTLILGIPALIFARHIFLIFLALAISLLFLIPTPVF